jgi:hypothetical protein
MSATLFEPKRQLAVTPDVQLFVRENCCNIIFLDPIISSTADGK